MFKTVMHFFSKFLSRKFLTTISLGLADFHILLTSHEIQDGISAAYTATVIAVNAVGAVYLLVQGKIDAKK